MENQGWNVRYGHMLMARQMRLFSQGDRVKISPDAITHVLFTTAPLGGGAAPLSKTDESPGRRIYVANEKHPFSEIIPNFNYASGLGAAGVPLVKIDTQCLSLTGHVTQYPTLVAPRLVNYIFVPTDADKRPVLHLHGGKKLTVTSTPAAVLAEFEKAKVELLQVPMLDNQGTAHIVTARVKTITEEGYAPLSESLRADFKHVFSINADGVNPLTPHAPRRALQFLDGSKVTAPMSWDPGAITNLERLKAVSPAL